MKKIVFLLFVFLIIIMISSNNKNLLIPKEAIRIRIIANSDELKDQEKKNLIKNDINSYLDRQLSGVDNYVDARNIIQNSLPNINEIVRKHESNFSVNFGKNYFPSKEYKGITYDSGEYDSLVITLGKGEGKNFWCILFPPICRINEENLSDADYQLYFLRLLKRIN